MCILLTLIYSLNIKSTSTICSVKFVTYASFGSSSLKTCTVSVLLLQHKNCEHILNDKLDIETHLLTPRLNSYSFAPSVTENTLMTVPFSEAVATRKPVGLNARAARGLSWAGIIIFEC